MFPSSNIVINSSSSTTTAINRQPVSYPLHDQPSFFIHRPNFHNDLTTTPNPNSNSKQENPFHHHPPLYCFDFPSPFGNDDVLLPQQQHHDLQSPDHSQIPGSLMREAAAAADGHQHQHQQSSTTTTTTTLIKMVDWDSNKLNHDKNIDQIPMRSSRRCCKRDRHSKIKTARGMRDRRMRLSLEIAREFFWLQDVLGFDKGSKTVEWLLKKAEPEIKKLIKLLPNLAAGTDHPEILNYYHISKSTSSATSESCEVVSGIDEVLDGDDHKPSSSSVLKESKRNNKRKRSAFHHPDAKASREKARARARERTRAKIRRRERSSSLVLVDEDQSKQQQQPGDQLSSWSTSPFEAGEESANNINHDPNIPNSVDQAQLLQADQLLEEPISSSQLAAAVETSTTAAATSAHQDLHLVDHNAHDSLVIMGRYWSPSPIFTSLQQSSSTTGISQEQHHQFADFQLFGKPWEAYNTHNLF